MGFLGERYQVAWLGAITLVVSLAVTFACRIQNAGAVGLVYVYGAATLVLAIVAVLRAWHDGDLFDWIRPAWGDFTWGFFSAGVLFAVSYAFSKYVVTPGGVRTAWLERAYAQVGDPESLRTKVSLVATAICVIAIAEELVWRGLVTTLFAEIAGSRKAWIYAAVLYSVAHAPTVWVLADAHAGYNPLVVVAALGAGLVWGALARFKDGRLVPGMISHALFDWSVVMMFRFWGPSV